MKFIFLINLSIIIICYSHNLNKLEFIEKKLYLKNNNLLYSLIPKYQAECIKILPAPKPIFKNRGNYSLESLATLQTDPKSNFRNKSLVSIINNVQNQMAHEYDYIDSNNRLRYQHRIGRRYRITSQNYLEDSKKKDSFIGQNLNITMNDNSSIGLLSNKSFIEDHRIKLNYE